MSGMRTVRGTRDLLPEDSRRLRMIEEKAWETARRYGYGEIATPIFEFTEVFARTLGDTSDVVTKEMYTFEDRGGDSVTLRPENTAGIVRAFLSNGLSSLLPLRVFYRGPMFRYERPQKGRLRQFQQVGVELLGVSDPLADVEVIKLAVDFFNELRARRQLRHRDQHAGRYGESRHLSRPPAGILRDAASSTFRRQSRAPRTEPPSHPGLQGSRRPPGHRRGAPAGRLRSTSARVSSLTTVLRGLDELRIAYQVNPRLVRGLDYYCHTTFEFVTHRLGAQGTLLAGGRYDGLVEQMGGQPTPGTGWAAGVERLMMLADGRFLRAASSDRDDRPGSGTVLNGVLARPTLCARDHVVVFGFGSSLSEATQMGE